MRPSRRQFLRHAAVGVAAGAWLSSIPLAAQQTETPLPRRPKVPGKLLLTMQARKKVDGKVVVEKSQAEWKVAETAIVICDMWDNHWCASAAERVDAMAPVMNRVISAARANGVMIVHAPSDTMDFYKDTPQRKRMQQAPAAEPPVKIERWCYLDKEKEIALPIDDSKGGCDDAEPPKNYRAWKRQHAALSLGGYDGVTDSGVELYNFSQQEGLRNFVLMGVHTNMCVLGRSFGIRQLTRLGRNVVLARDLTDAMYDPREKPQVSHTRGTQMVIEHIEEHWCPTIESSNLTSVIPGSADPEKS